MLTLTSCEEAAPPVADRVSPWVPISNPCDLKHLGKLVEELGECVAATGRCIIQGMDGLDPTTGELNADHLADELADVLANCRLVIGRFRMEAAAIEARAARKTGLLRTWHAMLEMPETAA